MDVKDRRTQRKGAAMDVNTPASMTPWMRLLADDDLLPLADEHLAVGEAASLMGVGVRTLQHWQERSRDVRRQVS